MADGRYLTTIIFLDRHISATLQLSHSMWQDDTPFHSELHQRRMKI